MTTEAQSVSGMKPTLSVFFSGASDVDGPIAAWVSADPGIVFSVATSPMATRQQGEALRSVSRHRTSK
jgi:hypothetical protein